MAWAEKQRSGRYAGKYRDAAGVTRGLGTTYTRKAEAERLAAVAEDNARRRPGQVDPKAGKLTWGEWWPTWWARRRIEPSTAVTDWGRVKKHVLPRWMNYPLAAIRREEVQSWVDYLEDVVCLGPESVRGIYALLSSSMRAAVVEQKIETSPCHDIELPALPEPDERFLTHTEVDAVCRVMPDKYRTLVLLLVGSGLRWGEAAGLHWHRVSLDEGWIDVREVLDTKNNEIKPYPKSGSARSQRLRRRVWLPDWLVDELRDHLSRYPRAAACGTRHRAGSRCRSSLVVPGRARAAVGYPSFRARHWGRAVGRTVHRIAGDPVERVFTYPREARANSASRGREIVPEWQDGLAGIGPCTIHDLRHTFASWALQAEPPMPIYDLAVAMGHTDTAVTARYGHLASSSRDRFRRALAWPSPSESATQTPRTVPGDGPSMIVVSESLPS